MPRYEYECPVCNTVETEVRTVDSRNKPGKCVICGGKTKHIMSACNFQPFEGSDRLRSYVDKYADWVEEAQREGITSMSEIDEGEGQAAERAKQLGVGVEKILGNKGKKPKMTKEMRENFAKQARAQNRELKFK